MYAFLHRKVIASLLLIALAFGGWYASGQRFLEDFEMSAKVQLGKFRSTSLSPDIVIVGLDYKSYTSNPVWPWPRGYHAEMVDKLNELKVDRIFFDIYFSKPSIPFEDQKLANSLSRSNAPIFLPVTVIEQDDGSYKKEDAYELFLQYAEEVDIGALATKQRQVRVLPYGIELDGKKYNSMSSEVTGRKGPADKWYQVDYAYDWRDVPTYSAVDVLEGKVDQELLRGKTILYGYYSEKFGDVYTDPSGQDMPGLATQAIGANLLLKGYPTVVGKWVPISIVLLFCIILTYLPNLKYSLLLAILAIPVFLISTIILDHLIIFVEVLPATVTLIVSCIFFQIAIYAEKFDATRRVHRESGLPNLQAFTEDRRNHKDSAVIAINFDGYDLVRRSLSNGQLHHLLGQIQTRLSVISNDVYQGTDGSLYFAMQSLEEKEIIESLQGLKMFFVNPIAIDGHMIALKPAFGYDIEPANSLTERSSHALVASCHAQLSEQKITRFDSALLDEEKQHLSMQTTIKRAMEKDELEVYIQPQIDLDSGWTNSGEVLIRWNDPLRGVISPGEFMPIMEKSPLISELTLHILQLAIDALDQILPLADDFKVSVNVPPSLMTDGAFIDRAFTLITTADIPNSAIMIEITERGMLFDKDIAKKSMERFVDAGIEFSIDDFGTANSNIEILRSIPASELKIDQSFIKELCDSPKDKALVESIINMAHGLDYKVVAEGVESKETLDLLTSLGSDKAQGYHIAKPLKIKDFTGHLIREFLHKRVLHRSKYG